MIPCCFAFPSKKVKKTRAGTGTSRFTSSEDVVWGKNDEMLTDLSTFSVEEQEKRLKEAKKAEERARMNAEIVDKIVRQDSKRIVVAS